MFRVLLLFLVTPWSKDPAGLKTKIKHKLEWLRVSIVLNWESGYTKIDNLEWRNGHIMWHFKPTTAN